MAASTHLTIWPIWLSMSLVEITGQSEDEAKTLIMKAREHWFTNDDASQAAPQAAPKA